MKRTLALVVCALVLTVLLVALGVAELGRTPEWRVELDAYLSLAHVPADGTVEVLSIERARCPYNMSASLSRARFGDDVYYGRTLPYPPQRVRCVLLERRYSASRVTHQVLLVALHQDLYHADWVVHEGETAPFSPSYLEQLEALRCHLDIP
jgi:hypothetical protein